MSMMWRLDERSSINKEMLQVQTSHNLISCYFSFFFRGTSNHLSERLTKCQDGRGLRPHKIHFWIRLPRDLMEHVSNKCKTWLCFHVITIFFSSKFQGQEIVNIVLTYTSRTQLYTSLKSDLHQDLNGGYVLISSAGALIFKQSNSFKEMRSIIRRNSVYDDDVLTEIIKRSK